jgi:hypothetical protein
VQLYSSDPSSWHVPPKLHGDDSHSSTSTSQLKPVKPAAHTQLKMSTSSWHVAPFTHGYDPHSLVSTSQCSPAQPAAHSHEYCTAHAESVQSPSVQLPPFMHGVDEHSSMSVQDWPLSLLS